jgi:hypothetical protein
VFSYLFAAFVPFCTHSAAMFKAVLAWSGLGPSDRVGQALASGLITQDYAAAAAAAGVMAGAV